MELYANSLYHIYNQGNNKERLFRESEDYFRFLYKIRALIKPKAEILAYCLMPNHFHFLVLTNQISIKPLKVGALQLTELTNGFRLLQSEFAQEINKKYKRTGSLFRQRTKYKLVDNDNPLYPSKAFEYILRNPIKDGLVDNLSHWPYSAYPDYTGERNGQLCSLSKGYEIFQTSPEEIKKLNIYSDLGDVPDYLL